MLRIGFALTIFCSLCLQSHATELNNAHLRQLAADYFNTYSQRLNFDRLMSFYADDALLEDVIYGHRAEGKMAIREFLDWGRGDFKLLQGSKILTIEQQVFGPNRVVTEGYFHRFSYQGKPLGPWRFIITLKFNSEGKISQHTDWINYTPREEFLGGKNLNPTVNTNNH